MVTDSSQTLSKAITIVSERLIRPRFAYDDELSYRLDDERSEILFERVD
jgi:hypothetical protein